MRPYRQLFALGALAAALALPMRGYALTPEESMKILQTIDDRQRNSGDYKSLVYIERKERNKNDTIFEALIYRRDTTDKLVILFQKPKEEAGKGYLRVDKNMFLYDPTVGKWERRTERERIAGTDSRRNDFDESRLAEEFTPTFIGDEKLGKFEVYHLELTAKPNVDVAFPKLQLWVDKESGNILKQQEVALSGRLMRTSYYPKWNKVFSESKKADVYIPAEIRIFDEVEKGNSTTVVIRKSDLNALDDSIFTKAWLESRSR